MEEVWKDIPGYEGKYQISNFGRVKSFAQDKKGKLLQPYINHHGYLKVALRDFYHKQRFFFIHRLVANSFLESVSGKNEINHKDLDKTNNAVYNLEWSTRLENMHHALENNHGGSIGPGEQHSNRKPVSIFTLDGVFEERFCSLAEASSKTGFPIGRVRKVLNSCDNTYNGHIWRWTE